MGRKPLAPPAVTEACPFLAIPEERGRKGDYGSSKRSQETGTCELRELPFPKKAQLQYNPSTPGFRDLPHQSLQTKAGWRKAQHFEMVPCGLHSPCLCKCFLLPASPPSVVPPAPQPLPHQWVPGNEDVLGKQSGGKEAGGGGRCSPMSGLALNLAKETS